MASVTQTIPNFLGGVSRQIDRKKQPGQVRDCLNAFPDPTFGLQKRPGFKFIENIYPHPTDPSAPLTDGKWFFIKRDNLETYIGVILDKDVTNHASKPIRIWNKEGEECEVDFELSPDSRNYLDTTRDNYDVLTVQDTSIIVNKTKTIDATAAPTTYVGKSFGTVVLKTVGYSVKYEVKLKVDNTEYSVDFTTLNAEDLLAPDNNTNPSEEKYNTADRILRALMGGDNTTNNGGPFTSGLKDLSISGHNLLVTKLDASLELALTTSGGTQKAFELSVSDNQANAFITAYSEQVANISLLPAESKHGRLAKVTNLGGAEAIFWSKFVADDGISGKGIWEETVSPEVSTGMDATTLPHELFNHETDKFKFRQPKVTDISGSSVLAWKNRAVGDDITNSHPSFVGRKIQQAFYHNNRLGFLTQDNVVMSKSDDFFNFYHTSALTSVDDDPIDINCSSVRPAVLHAVTPTAQGLILFSKNQQFIMFSDAEILTPSSAVIRGISNYEMDSTVAPVEVGTTINFVSKTPSYTRIFGMQTRGSEESPVIADIGKVVSEWVPDTITSLTSSPQNSLIAMYGTLDNTMYLYKTYIIGNQVLMQAWFNWDLPGNIQHVSIDSDTMWAVIEKDGAYHLISASLTQTPEETIMTTSSGQQINPHMDMYSKAQNGTDPTAAGYETVIYDTAGNFSKCYIPYDDITTLNPVILIAGNATQNFAGVTEYGFTVNPTRATDTNGTYFKVEGKNLEAQADNVYVGYQYNYDIELPRTYFKLDPECKLYDYNASLTIARMKFAVGLSSVVGFKVKRKGYIGPSAEFTGDGSTTAFKVPFLLKEENGIRITLDGAVQDSTSYSIARTVENGITIDTSDTVTFTTAPEQYTVKHLYGGSGYTASNGTGTGTATGVTTTAVNGTGLTVDITLSNGSITDVTIHGGSNYVEGEIVSISGGTGGGFMVGPPQKIKITTDTWYDVKPVQEANQYLSDDVPLTEQAVFTVPIHQRTDNFNMRVFSNSPFPLSLTSMMWEGRYSPRFYRRT